MRLLLKKRGHCKISQIFPEGVNQRPWEEKNPHPPTQEAQTNVLRSLRCRPGRGHCTHLRAARVLKLATFGPLLARTMGFPVRLVEYGLMLLVVFVATKRLARFRGKQALRLLQKAWNRGDSRGRL